jgi:hypothetical protein
MDIQIPIKGFGYFVFRFQGLFWVFHCSIVFLQPLNNNEVVFVKRKKGIGEVPEWPKGTVC